MYERYQSEFKASFWVIHILAGSIQANLYLHVVESEVTQIKIRTDFEKLNLENGFNKICYHIFTATLFPA